jgi:hypothetical protein
LMPRRELGCLDQLFMTLFRSSHRHELASSQALDAES